MRRSEAASFEESILSERTQVLGEDRIPVVRVAYLSYDGALDPLGATQVVPYLEGLAQRGAQVELITFEKPARLLEGARRSSMSARLSRAGINWHPLRYHKNPRVPSTLFDVVIGARHLRRLARISRFDLFHCRGDIAPVMVRMSRLSGPLLLDMRGFFSDERVDAGSWAAGGVLDKCVRVMERQNLARATRIVVLTNRGREVLTSRGINLPIDVIPTCVDPEKFRPRSVGAEPEFDLVYFGSLGGWYMTNEMLGFVEALRAAHPSIRILFLTNNASEQDNLRLRSAGVTVHSSPPEDVPTWLAKCAATFFFIRATPSKIASCPTKLAEALAVGLPVLTGPGIGDVDEILRAENVGVVLEDFSQGSYLRGWNALQALLTDPFTRGRCRSVATGPLSLGHAVDLYESAYRNTAPRGV